jgi:hypothetical protein
MICPNVLRNKQKSTRWKWGNEEGKTAKKGAVGGEGGKKTIKTGNNRERKMKANTVKTKNGIRTRH